MKFKIEIQSISDIITNSSSETFVLDASNYFVEDVRKLILDEAKKAEFPYEKYEDKDGNINWTKVDALMDKDRESPNPKYDFSSGMGGELTVKLCEDDEGKQYILIDVDHSRRHTIKFIQDTFEVIESW